MEIVELHAHMEGVEFYKRKKINPQPTQEEMSEMINNVLTVTGAKENLETCELPKHFFDYIPLLRMFVPSKYEEEVFYALKSGHYSPDMPSKIIYAAQEALKTGAVNNFLTLFNTNDYNTIFSEGYLPEGYSMYDAVCSVVGEFNLIKPWTRIVKSNQFEGFHEVFVPTANYVAVVPSDIAEALTEDDVDELNVKKGILQIGEVPLLHLGNYIGVSSGTFDLRTAR